MESIDYIIGATIQSITGMEGGSDLIIIQTDKGEFRMFHNQHCCERVSVEDVVGDVADLIGAIVVVCEERTNDGASNLETWTFYELRTTKGDVTIRWYGSSNGHYGVSMSTSWTPNFLFGVSTEYRDADEGWFFKTAKKNEWIGPFEDQSDALDAAYWENKQDWLKR